MIGRDRETALLRDLVARVEAGRGGGLVLLGEAGIGKSTVLGAAADLTTSLHVSRISGVQAERDIPFAGLHALVGGLASPSLEVLAVPQRDALEVALGRARGERPGRLLLGTALLTLLAAQPPTLVLVDDLQWVDLPSVDALAFAVRRLVAEPVGVVMTVRTGDGYDVSRLAGLPHAVLAGIEDPVTLLPFVAPEVARAIAGATGGNPLAMVEVAASLSDDERSGRQVLSILPETDPEAVFARRLADLGPAPRAAVRVLALAGRSPLDVQVRALTAIGAHATDADVLAERSLADPVLPASWRHPLARAAAARGTPAEVRDAHRALAQAWEGAATPARAWHLAAAAEGVDREAAAALVAVAEDADRREASAEAADAWARAATLVPDDTRRAAYTESAARAALRSGATQQAAGLLDEALLRQPGPEATARLLWQRGRIQHTLGEPLRALDFLVQAQDLARDRDLRVWASAEGVLAAMYAARPDQATRMAGLVEHHHDPDDPVHAFLTAHARGAAAALNADPDAARSHFDAARRLLADGVLAQQLDLLVWAISVELFDPRDPALSPELEQAISLLRRRGDLTWLPRVTHLAASRAELSGDWESMEAFVEEGELLSRMSGQTTQLQEALVGLCELAALRGDAAAMEPRLAELHTLQDGTGVSMFRGFVAWLSSLVAMTAGDHEAAAVALRSGVAVSPDLLPWLVGSVLHGSGLAAAAAELDRWPGVPAHHRLVAEAVVGDPEDLAGLASEHPGPVESAILHVWAGEGLRRSGARTRAREELRTARETFWRLGATPWLDRVDAELRASGATLRRTGEGEQLTASETRVATLATRGMSNKDIAAALFLSPKTVEFHLGNAYRKLGVGNRTALASAMARHRE